MDTLGSDIIGTDEIPLQDRVPLSGEALDVALRALESPDYVSKLTVRIMQLARKKGFHSPFADTMDLPGGESASDLANDIMEKALAGNYTWDREKFPDFTNFCLSRTESILSNWLDRMKNFMPVSPLMEKNPDSGNPIPNALTRATASGDLYADLRVREGGALGDKFLEDLALILPDNSVEQRIIMAVFDDRECANRAFCRGKLGLSESDYDAAMKRLMRKIPVFGKEWRTTNKISEETWEEAQ